MHRFVPFLLMSVMSGGARAQAIEDVLVETYAVSPDPDGGPALTTYRIFLDLAPAYRLQMIYGDEAHPLVLSSSTAFFNDTVNGGKFADDIDGDQLNRWPAALDTWLTIGSASGMHKAVPKAIDPDGSSLECPPYPGTLGAGPSGAHEKMIPLCVADGLVSDTARRDIVDFKFASGYLHRSKGNVLETTDGAWAVLGGCAGATPENMVLIAQVTTSGTLHFKLNAQLAGPDRVPAKYVSSAPAPGEVLCEKLARQAVR